MLILVIDFANKMKSTIQAKILKSIWLVQSVEIMVSSKVS